MSTRCSPGLALVLLLLTGASAAADDHAEVERHLQRLSAAAAVRGPVAADEAVHVVVGLPWRHRATLDRFIRRVTDPQSPLYQRYLTPGQFERRFAPRPAQVAALAAFLRTAGLQIADVAPSHSIVTAVGRADRVEHALGTALLDVIDAGRRTLITASKPLLPSELGAQVLAVGTAPALRPPREAAAQQRAVVDAPFDPREIARLYEFDALYAQGIRGRDDRAGTIAIATAFDFDPADLEGFWRQFGIARTLDSVEVIPVDGRSSDASMPDRRETTLDVEWASAMAPGARVLVYAGSDALSTTFLRTYDRIISDNRAAVLTTSWGRCENDFPAAYLAQVDTLFARAAAQGITVVAASGDAGGYDCTGQDTPSVGFPASHPYVLAVGGTSVQPAVDGTVEVAWTGSGGGVSSRWPAPPWQMQAEPHRMLADVSLHADPAAGYRTLHAGTWVAFGGTSVGAPIWAALVGLINQAREQAARPPLGLAAPLLCEVAAAGVDAFVDITAGDNGAFAAGTGWDAPTGWGVPRAAALAWAMSDWTPPADAEGGVSEMVPLAPTAAGAASAARMRFQRRCLATEINAQFRRLPVGTYTLGLDDEEAASFATDARGNVLLTLTDIDVRGHRITVRGADGTVYFSSGSDAPPLPGEERVAAMVGTSMAGDASGSLVYQANGGRERLTVRTERLPLGSYDVRLGGTVIGTLTVTNASMPSTQLFDSSATSGATLPMSPLCRPVIVARGSVAYLRSATDALAPGACGG